MILIKVMVVTYLTKILINPILIFGMFSSIPIGYNHPIFDQESFKNEIEKVSKFKIVNCEFSTDEYDRFYQKFMDFSSCGGKYVKSHFVSTS